MSTAAVARDVLGIRRAPPGLAARLVYDLLGTDGRLCVDGEGVWSLAARTPLPWEACLAELEYAVVDVETTGSSVARGARIVEIAAVHVRNGRMDGEYSTLVDPGGWIPGWVTRLTGIEQSMVLDAPRFEQIADAVRGSLEGHVFVAHNVAFDWRFVAEEMRRARSVIPEGPRLCTVRLAKRVLPGLRRRGLDSLARYYGVEIVGRHRAGGDARATAAILIHLLAAADGRGIRSWGQLQDWLAGRPVSPFGDEPLALEA